MNAKEADRLGRRIRTLIDSDRGEEALTFLAPVLEVKTPFRLLDRIGRESGKADSGRVCEFTSLVARTRTMGAWPFCGSALKKHLDREMAKVLELCRDYIIHGDVWYATDTLAERLPGPALVLDPAQALNLLSKWCGDTSPWVRRAVGVAVHLWAKRAKGNPEKEEQVKVLLEFMEPLFQEHNMDAAKGVGWGLKTMGRYYPGPTAAWLGEQIRVKNRRPKAVVLRKAMTYISPLRAKAD